MSADQLAVPGPSTPWQPVVRRVAIVVAIAVATVIISVAGIVGPVWWEFGGGSDWWHHRNLRHGLTDGYRANPEAFDEAVAATLSVAAQNPDAWSVFMSVSSMCVWGIGEDGRTCTDLSDEEAATVPTVEVEGEQRPVHMSWDADEPDIVVVAVGDSESGAEALVYAVDGIGLDTYADFGGLTCGEMLTDEWCVRVRD